VDPSCIAYPTGANASSSSTTLIWEKGGKGSGGVDNLGGDVFLSTTLNMGCGGGYYGSQMHWNTSSMNLDWAIWDMGSSRNTHPINPVDEDGRPIKHGKLCSIKEPPPPGFVQCACSRYDGEGFGTHCGIGKDDGWEWEMGTAYTLNISLDPSVENNASDATFRFTVLNERSQELIEVGRIRTTSPPGTPEEYTVPEAVHRRGFHLQEEHDGENFTSWAKVVGPRFRCNTMVVGGGSFQEFFDGGNFTSWATISGPRFRGVQGQTKDITPTGFQACAFFGNCSGGYGGCHNETLFYSKGAGAGDCSKTPIAAGATCGHEGMPAVSFKGGPGQPVANDFIPPWYHWAPKFSSDGSAGPDGGTLPESDSCEYAFHSNRLGGSDSFANWATIPYGGSQPYSMPQNCDNETSGAGSVGRCSRLCCAYCLADKDCVEATLIGHGCHLFHVDSKLPFTPWNNASMGITTVLPKRLIFV